MGRGISPLMFIGREVSGMARLDVEEYRRLYLKEVQERIIAKKENVPHYTSKLLNEAILAEMNRADEDTCLTLARSSTTRGLSSGSRYA